MKIALKQDWAPQELAATIADIIRTKPEMWGQDTWYSLRTRGMTVEEFIADLTSDATACGTTACVAGHAAILTAPPGSIIRDGYLKLPDGFTMDADIAGRAALCIEPREASYLFAASRTEEEVLAALDQLAMGEHITIPEHGCDCCGND